MCFSLLWVWGLHSGLTVPGGGSNVLLRFHGVAGEFGGQKMGFARGWRGRKEEEGEAGLGEILKKMRG